MNVKGIYMKKATLFCLFMLATILPGFSREGFRTVFYNVENFFDCKHDSLKNDYEFLPGGIRGWTPTRFWKKAGQISRVVAAVGEDRFPELVGLAEVENENCIHSLLRSAPLKNAQYHFIHEESPDARGVDVCLLYNRYLFEPIRHQAMSVVFPNEPEKKTRQILYVCGQVFPNDTLHLFIVHASSRLGGVLESESYRRFTASLIRQKVDSLFQVNIQSKILIMGDFNDYPTNRSLTVDLNAKAPTGRSHPGDLYNLMVPLDGNPETGTNKHQADWGILDQLLVSGSLRNLTPGARIFDADFLLLDDKRWLGRKPFRTYHGMTWQGGYSDHLPVYVDFKF